MSALELLRRLESLGIGLRADDGRLQVSAPRGRLTDELRDAVASNKATLLALLEARKPREVAALTVLPRTSPLPLSLFQERLWVLNRLEPENTSYTLAILWTPDGPVDIDRYRAAITTVVERHDILHASFRDHEDGAAVYLLPLEAVRIDVHDARDLAPEERLPALLAARDEAAKTRFDLSREPPVQFNLYRFSGGGTAMLAALHHIAVDAWSIDILLKEIDAVYKGTLLKPVRLQYADFAAWQRGAHASGAVRAELDWWAQRLAGAPPLSTFPAEQLPPSEPGVAPSHFHDLRLSRNLSDRVRLMARESGVTVYMAFLAACAVVLHRHTGQTDLVLGSPMGVREQPELEKMIGPFINLLLLRLDLSGDPGFADLLGRTREAVLEAHAHRHLPFEALLERLKPERSFQHSPLFQVAVVQHNAPTTSGVQIVGGGALHEMTLFVREVEQSYDLSFEYRPDLYSPETVARIAAHLEAILSAAVQDMRLPIGRMTMLTGEERRLVVDQFNETAAHADPATFVERFERQVASSPEVTALVFEEEALSYGELNRRANKLARHLRAHGVCRDSTVAVCLERTPALVIALVGVQKAGATYLPLDPAFPPSRLDFMIGDSGSMALVTSSAGGDDLDAPAGMLIVDLDEQAARIDSCSPENLQAVVEPQDAAYMIYTSGSTGRPKGVVVSHAALANFLWSMQREPGMSRGDVLAAVTTISFDISGLEIYLPLVVGARIELIAREVASDGPALAQQLGRCGATIMQATPATWRLLLESDWTGGPGFKALCGGESLARELADSLLERVGALWNLYGPTETTIWSTAAVIGKGPEPVTIGRPIANTRVYVVDPSGSPVPVGVPGEIWIGGAGVALGYHRRPELTVERFVADPFNRSSKGRLYRTGDLGRWDAEGRLHHLGRMDHQVKVRGFRIELGEIEASLLANPAVHQAICVTHEAGPADMRLIAYIVFNAGLDLTVSEVRRYLKRRLPDHMVPSVIVAVDSIPLTPNGKADRSALPDPFRDAGRSRQFEPPAPGLEQTIAAIWQDILRIERVDAEDNFFELGGHSLLSLRVAAAFRKVTGLRMDPRSLFFQSLRQVAATAAREAEAARAQGTR